MTDIQCEHCGWIGDEGLYTPAAPKGTSDLVCPACEQVCEGFEVDWKERAKAAEAEIAGWRLAVRYETVNTENHYHLKVGGVTVGVVVFVDRWSAMTMGTHYLELGSRDAACAKLCEVLGIPVVVPTAPPRQ